MKPFARGAVESPCAPPPNPEFRVPLPACRNPATLAAWPPLMSFPRPRIARAFPVLVAAVGFVWASPVRAVEPPPAQTFAALVERIRAILPDGWTVEDQAATGAVIISRDEKVLTVAEPPSAAAMEPEPAKQVFACCFRLAPLMSVENFRRLSAQNQKSRQELNHLRTEIYRVINARKADGLVLPPASGKNLALVLRYEEVRQSFHRLPDFYYDDASVWSIHPDRPVIVDDTTRQECADVRAKVEGLFSRYPAP